MWSTSPCIPSLLPPSLPPSLPLLSSPPLPSHPPVKGTLQRPCTRTAMPDGEQCHRSNSAGSRWLERAPESLGSALSPSPPSRRPGGVDSCLSCHGWSLRHHTSAGGKRFPWKGTNTQLTDGSDVIGLSTVGSCARIHAGMWVWLGW